MHFIKTCPKCNRKIRFPLDKGKIKVKCTCGYSFIADPDDTGIYKSGKFDLNGKKSRKPTILSRFAGLIRISSGEKFSLENAIKNLLKIKYKVQNFRLLPTSEQKKIIYIFLAMMLLITFIIIIFSLIKDPGNTVV